jgi:hypothetical protein
MKTFLWELILKVIDIFVKVVITAIAKGIIAKCSNKRKRSTPLRRRKCKRGSAKYKKF